MPRAKSKSTRVGQGEAKEVDAGAISTRRVRLPITASRRTELSIELVTTLRMIDDKVEQASEAAKEMRGQIAALITSSRHLRKDIEEGAEARDVEVYRSVNFEQNRVTLYEAHEVRPVGDGETADIIVGQAIETRALTQQERDDAAQGRLV